MHKTTGTEIIYPKLDIALEYLNLAIQLYMEKRDYFCAIHLAGAAEELFCKHLSKDACIYTVALQAQKSLQILESSSKNCEDPKEPTDKNDIKIHNNKAHKVLTDSKNLIKHMDGDKDKNFTFHLGSDPTSEAERYIEQALINFYKLNPKLPKSRTIWDFEDYNH